jgi:hypothetical protein
MDGQKTKEQQLDDFLSSEASGLSLPFASSDSSASSAHKAGAMAEPSIVDGIGNGDRQRHSIRTCACERCAAKRVALARRWDLIPDPADSEEELPEIDPALMGKLLTVPHTYKATINAVKYPEIAAIWKVSEETEDSLGRFGNAVLTKWLKKANFPYKTELILGLYWSGDIGIRLLNESKLKALIDAERSLK